MVVTGKEVSGTLEIELSTEVYDDFISAAYFNEWQRKGEYVAADFSSINGAVVAFVDATGLAVGQLLLVEGLGGTNDGLKKITAISADDVTLSGLAFTGSTPDDVVMRVVGYETDTAPTVSTVAKTITVENTGFNFRKGEFVGVNLGKSHDDTGFYRVLSVGSSSGNQVITYDLKDDYKDFSDLPSGQSRLMVGDYLVNGVTRRTLALLQRFESHTPTSVFRNTGISVGSFELSLEAQALVTASLEVQGLDNLEDTTNYTLQQSAEQNKFSTGSDISSVLVGGQKVEAPDIVQSVSISLNNNLRNQVGVGFIGTASVAAGTCEITGEINMFFGTKDFYNQLVNNEESSFYTGFADQNSKRFMLFDLPRIKFSSGIPDVPAKDQDIELTLGYQAVKTPEAVGGYQALVQTFFWI